MPTRYIVHGTDSSSTAVRKIIEAQSAAEAERMGGRLGLTVTGVEVDPSSVENGSSQAAVRNPFDEPQSARKLGPETQLWQGCPSQWVNFWWFLSCLLVIPIPWAIWRWLDTKYSKFTLTTQRLRFERGVLNRTIDEVELYRVKDTQLHQTVIDRVLGIGTIEILSSDETNPELYLRKISSPKEVREQLRLGVERLRLARGVREFDLALDGSPGDHAEIN